MKTCPYCAEEIKDAAIRCRWCLTWLVEEIPAGAEAAAPAAAIAEMAPAAKPASAPVTAADPAATPEPAVTAEPASTAESASGAEATPAAGGPEAKVEFTHTGTRYLLGFGSDHFGIWDRNAPQQPLERFPRTDDGWAAAWQRYVSIESNWMDLRTGQRSG